MNLLAIFKKKPKRCEDDRKGRVTLEDVLAELRKTKLEIMAKVSELKDLLTPIKDALTEAAGSLAQVGPQLDKATKEIIDALGKLDVDLPEEVTSAIADIGTIASGLKATGSSLKTASQTLDDLNPDAPTA